MRRMTTTGLAALVALALAACDGEEAAITTSTADASQLTTTTTVADGSEDTSGSDTTDAGPTTTVDMGDPIESYEVISRESTEDGETLYILVEPGDYSDISFENFLGDLLEDETAVSGVEVFDDRVALDAAIKAQDERTADELAALEDHHLVSLANGREVSFQGPLDDFDDFVIGS
jgi:hypothetical protein